MFQVKKLVQKLVSRDTLNYRKLTDKPVAVKDGDKGEEEVEENSDEKSVKKIDDFVLAQGVYLPGLSSCA